MKNLKQLEPMVFDDTSNYCSHIDITLNDLSWVIMPNSPNTKSFHIRELVILSLEDEFISKDYQFSTFIETREEDYNNLYSNHCTYENNILTMRINDSFQFNLEMTFKESCILIKNYIQSNK